MKILKLDPFVFSPDAIAPETKAMNDELIARLNDVPDQWTFTPEEVRDRRAKGLGAFPPTPLSERAETKVIAGPAGPLELRIMRAADPRGVYFHIHGGGWMFGGASEQDQRLERIVDECSLTVVSVEYRLAPDHPYPAANDDCEAAALWLVEHARTEFAADLFAIGGESAGAHLSVVTLLRLRDRHGLSPFKKANLIAGCYDLNLTPSARAFGDERLILRTIDIENFVSHYVVDFDRNDHDISPLYADLKGLPEALFSVGTRDALVDDSLFMANRWVAAGNRADLRIYPGGAHVFEAFPMPLAEESLGRMRDFLNADDTDD